MRTVLAITAALLFASPAFAGHAHHKQRATVRCSDCFNEGSYGYSYRLSDPGRVYEGPMSDFGTSWYGENGGTVHYGNFGDDD